MVAATALALAWPLVGSNRVAVKITGMLGEELLLTAEM